MSKAFPPDLITFFGKMISTHLERVSEGDEERMFDILEEDVSLRHDMTSFVSFHYCHFIQNFDGVNHFFRLMFGLEDLDEKIGGYCSLA